MVFSFFSYHRRFRATGLSTCQTKVVLRALLLCFCITSHLQISGSFLGAPHIRRLCRRCPQRKDILFASGAEDLAWPTRVGVSPEAKVAAVANAVARIRVRAFAAAERGADFVAVREAAGIGLTPRRAARRQGGQGGQGGPAGLCAGSVRFPGPGP